jgi:hypothetical protein
MSQQRLCSRLSCGSLRTSVLGCVVLCCPSSMLAVNHSVVKRTFEHAKRVLKDVTHFTSLALTSYICASHIVCHSFHFSCTHFLYMCFTYRMSLTSLLLHSLLISVLHISYVTHFTSLALTSYICASHIVCHSFHFSCTHFLYMCFTYRMSLTSLLLHSLLISVLHISYVTHFTSLALTSYICASHIVRTLQPLFTISSLSSRHTLTAGMCTSSFTKMPMCASNSGV